MYFHFALPHKTVKKTIVKCTWYRVLKLVSTEILICTSLQLLPLPLQPYGPLCMPAHSLWISWQTFIHGYRIQCRVDNLPKSVRRDANWSTSIGPKILIILLNRIGFNFQSDRSTIVQDSTSAMWFCTPGRCWAVMWMLRSRHHIHCVFARSTNSGETVPPRLFMYAKAEVLSNLRRTDNLDLYFRNVSEAASNWGSLCASGSLPETMDLRSVDLRILSPSPSVRHLSLTSLSLKWSDFPFHHVAVPPPQLLPGMGREGNLCLVTMRVAVQCVWKCHL